MAELPNYETEDRGMTKNSNFSTFYWKDTHAFLFEFDPKHGMPVKATGYFEYKDRKGKAIPGAFKDVSYVSETKWECVDNERGVYAPVSITNLTNRISPKVPKTLLLELNCSYKVKDLSEEMLSEENLKLLLVDKGPMPRQQNLWVVFGSGRLPSW